MLKWYNYSFKGNNMSKYKTTIIEVNPVSVHYNKNGRAPKVQHVLAWLKKDFPNIVNWKLQITDHSVLATEERGVVSV